MKFLEQYSSQILLRLAAKGYQGHVYPAAETANASVLTLSTLELIACGVPEWQVRKHIRAHHVKEFLLRKIPQAIVFEEHQPHVSRQGVVIPNRNQAEFLSWCIQHLQGRRPADVTKTLQMHVSLQRLIIKMRNSNWRMVHGCRQRRQGTDELVGHSTDAHPSSNPADYRGYDDWCKTPEVIRHQKCKETGRTWWSCDLKACNLATTIRELRHCLPAWLVKLCIQHSGVDGLRQHLAAELQVPLSVVKYGLNCATMGSIHAPVDCEGHNKQQVEKVLLSKVAVAVRQALTDSIKDNEGKVVDAYGKEWTIHSRTSSTLYRSWKKARFAFYTSHELQQMCLFVASLPPGAVYAVVHDGVYVDKEPIPPKEITHRWKIEQIEASPNSP